MKKPKSDKKPTKKAKKKSNAKADRAKKGASAAAGTKPVKAPDPQSEPTRKMISGAKLKALAKGVQQAMDQSASAGGVAGELISTAVKKEGLNAPAFRIAHRLLRLGERDPVKLRVMLDDLEYYIEKLELDDLAGDSLFQPREGAQDNEDEEEGDGQTEAPPTAPGNVASLDEHRGAAA